MTPGGYSRPPAANGRLVSRTTNGRIVRTRRLSRIAASRYVSRSRCSASGGPPPVTRASSSARRAITSGRGRICSRAQASASAVVSCPANSRVTTASRTSWSESGVPSAWVAASRSARMPFPRPDARRPRIIGKRTSSRACSCRKNGTHRFRSRSASTDSSAGPITARTITRSVIRRVDSSTGTGRPAGQAAASSRVAACMAPKKARIRSPLSGGSSTRRWRACGSPSSTSTEFSPTEYERNSLPSPECRASGSPRNTSRTASGDERKTSVPYPVNRAVKASPWRQAHRSRNGSGEWT